MEEKEYGLVLAGGGTKGAYEVGIWKALKEMNINITAIVGASMERCFYKMTLWQQKKCMKI